MDAGVPEDSVIAAPVTALLDNGDLNSDAVGPYCKFLCDNGIDGVFILGTMGEGMNLTVTERKEAAEAWVKHRDPRLKSIIVQIGAGNLRESIELARHVSTLDVTAFACMSPQYFRPANEEALVEYLAQVAAAAPNLPFYYYCINFMTGVYLNTAKVLQLAKPKIPNLKGVKMSSRELPGLLDCVTQKDFFVMVGTDEQFLPALSIGVRVPILNGYLGQLYRQLREAYDRGDRAQAMKEMKRARDITLLRAQYGQGGGPAAVKAMMKCLGLDLGPVRSPLVSVNQDQLGELAAKMKELGLPTVSEQ